MDPSKLYQLLVMFAPSRTTSTCGSCLLAPNSQCNTKRLHVFSKSFRSLMHALNSKALQTTTMIAPS
jgi:hypothetical protein